MYLFLKRKTGFFKVQFQILDFGKIGKNSVINNTNYRGIDRHTGTNGISCRVTINDKNSVANTCVNNVGCNVRLSGYVALHLVVKRSNDEKFESFKFGFLTGCPNTAYYYTNS